MQNSAGNRMFYSVNKLQKLRVLKHRFSLREICKSLPPLSPNRQGAVALGSLFLQIVFILAAAPYRPKAT